MSITLSGLRIFVIAPVNDESRKVVGVEDQKVFYSRRGNGPIYCWLYEEKLAHWRARRMNTSDFDSHKLSNASWKTVPESLQTQLGAHYLD
jgi:hypothetical protein